MPASLLRRDSSIVVFAKFLRTSILQSIREQLHLETFYVMFTLHNYSKYSQVFLVYFQLITLPEFLSLQTPKHHKQDFNLSRFSFDPATYSYAEEQFSPNPRLPGYSFPPLGKTKATCKTPSPAEINNSLGVYSSILNGSRQIKSIQ